MATDLGARRGDRHCGVRSAVKGTPEGDDGRSVCGDLGQLDCALYRFCSAIRPKNLIQSRGQRFSEGGSSFHHWLVREDVLLGVDDFGRLFLNCGDDPGMAVTRIDDRNARGEICPTRSVEIPDVNAFSAINGDW